MRAAFVENEHERAAADDRTRNLSEAERQKAAAAAVAAAMTVCVEDHWTEAMVNCLLAKPGAKGSECGFPPPGFRHLNTAVEATYTQAFGPRKGSSDDGYTQWAGQHSAEHRHADGSPELPSDKTSHAGLGAAAAKMVGSDAGSAAEPAAAPGGGW